MGASDSRVQYNYHEVNRYIKSELLPIYDANEIYGISRLVFEHILGSDAIKKLSFVNTVFNNEQYSRIKKITERLKDHEPIQYVIGETVFYDVRLKVTPGVLIPRQETEELVHWVINDCRKNNQKILTIVDLCTGSGCIAIALADKVLNSVITATDYSEKILEIANDNARLNNAQISFIKQDILNLEGSIKNDEAFDIIVSNPPYITESEKTKMAPNVLRFEPHEALFVPDEDPLLFYRKILEFAKVALKDNGKIYFEINEAYGNQMVHLMEYFGYKNVELRKDINGKDRMVRGIK